jgi:hypothetical protein
MITSKQLKKFSAQMDAADADTIFDVITPNGKRFGDCTSADLLQIADTYEAEAESRGRAAIWLRKLNRARGAAR